MSPIHFPERNEELNPAPQTALLSERDPGVAVEGYGSSSRPISMRDTPRRPGANPERRTTALEDLETLERLGG
jgi:hypothetical protein